MESMRNLSVEEFINLTGSQEPAPGGGSVAAVAGSLGAALGHMVMSLSVGKKSYQALDESIRSRLEEAMVQLEKMSHTFLQLMDEDTDVFMSFMAAMKLPKETDEDKKKRHSAMQKAALESMKTPLKTAELCVQLAQLLPEIAQYGNKNAVSDAGVGALMCRSACEAAVLNVKINLSSVEDETEKEEARRRAEQALDTVDKLQKEILKTVYTRIG